MAARKSFTKDNANECEASFLQIAIAVTRLGEGTAAVADSGRVNLAASAAAGTFHCGDHR